MRLANGSYYQRRLPVAQKQNFKYTAWNTWRGGDSDNDSDDDDECSSSSSSSSLSSIDSISDYELLDDMSSNVKLQQANTFRRPQKVSDNIVVITTSPSISLSNQLDGDKFNDDQPPTPWGKSTAKMRIIDELSDPTSDIPLCWPIYCR